MILPNRYSPTPTTTPKIANSQMLDALVNPVVLSAFLINAPAPKKPIPVTTDPTNTKGLSTWMDMEMTDSAQAPMDTKVNVPKLMGLCNFCLMRPKKSEPAKTNPKRNKTMVTSMICCLERRRYIKMMKEKKLDSY